MDVLLLFILLLVIHWVIEEYVFDISVYAQMERCHDPEYPFVQIHDDFYTSDRCKELSNYVLKHKYIGKSTLYGFEKTKGFVVTFSSQHEQRFADTFKPIYEVFKQVREPGTNAYIFNPVVIEPSTSEIERSIDFHYDVSLEEQIKTDDGRNFLPVSVTVIYIELPDTYEGGHLRLSNYGSVDSSKIRRYKPKLGRKFVFRGDALHCVEPIYCKNPKSKRISLVFEQYKIPDSKLEDITFDVSTTANIKKKM
jgi:hypothetical protein